MTTSQTPNAEEQRRGKQAAMKEHVQDLSQRIEQMKDLDAQIKAWLDTVKHNVSTALGNNITAMESHRKIIQSRIDAGQ